MSASASFLSLRSGAAFGSSGRNGMIRPGNRSPEKHLSSVIYSTNDHVRVGTSPCSKRDHRSPKQVLPHKGLTPQMDVTTAKKQSPSSGSEAKRFDMDSSSKKKTTESLVTTSPLEIKKG